MTLEEELDVRYNIGKKEGLAEGRQEGLAEGEQNAARESARKMKAKGFEEEDIAEITGLTIVEIREL